MVQMGLLLPLQRVDDAVNFQTSKFQMRPEDKAVGFIDQTVDAED